MFAGLADGIMVVDVRGRIADLNPAAERMIGSALRQVVGHSVGDILSPVMRGAVTLPPGARPVDESGGALGPWSEIEAALGGPGEKLIDFPVAGADAEPRWYNVRISPLLDRRGRVHGRLLVGRDVTEQRQQMLLRGQAEAAIAESKALRQSEEALRQAAERLHELDQLKSQFVSNVSHELRTPLANIKLYLGLLATAGPEDREAFLQTIDRECSSAAPLDRRSAGLISS